MAAEYKSETSARIKETPDSAPVRCGCGSLLARVVPEGVELKCRRCKRQVIVPLNQKTPVRISM
jgi:phage FluMu protein Com